MLGNNPCPRHTPRVIPGIIEDPGGLTSVKELIKGTSRITGQQRIKTGDLLLNCLFSTFSRVSETDWPPNEFLRAVDHMSYLPELGECRRTAPKVLSRHRYSCNCYKKAGFVQNGEQLQIVPELVNGNVLDRETPGFKDTGNSSYVR